MHQIKNEKLGNVSNVIWKNRDSMAIGNRGGFVPLFGAVGGSISLNLANEGSDIDFYLITEEQEGKDVIRTVHLENMEIDFMCVPMDELVEECEKYAIQNHRYPTRFYRNESEMNNIIHQKDIERPDFKREMIMRIFLADEILEFKQDAMAECYKRLKKGLLLIDIWDYHFNRAYGNYHEHVEGRENVLLRKYLYIISQIVTCYMLLNDKKIWMNYRQMLIDAMDIYMDNEIFEICNDLWMENSRVFIGKNKVYMTANLKLNEWIEGSLVKLLRDMKNKEKFLRSQYLTVDSSKIKKLRN